MGRKTLGCGICMLFFIYAVFGILYAGVVLGVKGTIMDANKTAPATVIKVSQSLMRKSADSVKVEYEVNGKTYKGTVLSKKGSVNEGGELNIYYHPLAPRKITTKDEVDFKAGEFRIYINIFIASAVLGLIFMRL